ncbi:hypothetical protein HT031_001449 [Scenedesmus sp. PABB004]|nr:hypothetical protein HT031_001449 [Scenedesmus sp. PABB004]
MADGDDEINLESLKTLKRIFEVRRAGSSSGAARAAPPTGRADRPQEADEDGSGELDIDEFCAKLGPHLGVGLKRAQVAQLFLKIDADAGGTVDRVFYCAPIDKVVSLGRDGSLRLWNGGDLSHARTLANGAAWLTDALYLPGSRKLVAASMDRALTYYDTHRGAYDLTGRVYACGGMGVPLCLAVLAGDAGERVVYGDSRGAADYIYLHTAHSDWVTQIGWVPEVGLVSSSLDGTVQTYDINRERVSHVCRHHAKGVRGWVWCAAYSCFASAGLERDVIVWHGTTGRKIGELRGHTSSVAHISLDAGTNHVFTLSTDHTIKLWDLRNHRCLQTMTPDDWSRAEDSAPTCMAYDSTRRRLVTAALRPCAWQHKVTSADRTGHREPVRGALFNATFAVVVSVDEGGTACDGARVGRFAGDHGGSRVTALTFDKRQRRLVTAANDGSIHMYNFHNGARLRSFVHNQAPLEVCEVLFARDDKRGADTLFAAGWNTKVFVWEDTEGERVSTYKALEGHREDVTAMAAHARRGLLATGDYQGHIVVWGLFTGERKSWLSHRAERYETSVERLLWVPAFSPAQRAAAADAAAERAAAADAAAAATERAGAAAASSAEGFFAGDGEPAADQQEQPSLVLGSEVPSTSGGAAECGLHGAQQLDGAAGEPGGGLGQQPVSGREPAEAEEEAQEEPDALLLLSAGGDGLVRVWSINHLAQGAMLCMLPGANSLLDVVSAAGVDGGATVVVLGDSGGHLRVFDVAAGIDTSSAEAAAASFKQRAHWLAHDGAVTSVDLVPARPTSSSTAGGTAASPAPGVIQPLVVSAGRDAAVALWTLDGGLVGRLGEHGWDLDRPGTWQDAGGAAARPPKPLRDGLYLQPQQEQQQQGQQRRSSSARHREQPQPQQRQQPLASQHSGDAGGWRAQGAHGARSRSGSPEPPGGGAPIQQPDGAAAELGGGLAALVLQGCKAKAREAMVATPEQPYGQLRVHALCDVDVCAGDILHAAAEKRRTRSRHLAGSASGNSHISSWSGVSGTSRPGGFNWRGAPPRRKCITSRSPRPARIAAACPAAAGASGGKMLLLSRRAHAQSALPTCRPGQQARRSVRRRAAVVPGHPSLPGAPPSAGGKEALVGRLLAAKEATGKSFSQLASELGLTNVYTAQLFHHQQQLQPRTVPALRKAVPGLTDGDVAEMQRAPFRRFDPAILQEPAVYRLYEAITHGGEALKAIISEEFGDGIMSAIDFSATVEQGVGAQGERRVKILLNGKFLPYVEQRVDGSP